MRKFIFILLGLFFSINIFAGSISGGEIFYDYLGNGTLPNSSKYKITVKIFTNNNDPSAEMPSNIMIGIFDNFNNKKISNSPFNVNRLDLYPAPVKNTIKCVSSVPAINFRVGEFVFEIDLLDNYRGYTVAYQGVNREKSFENINVIQYERPDLKPDGGSTFACYIIGTTALPLKHNNSARFNTTVEGICKGSGLSYDFSATDPDGDSLAYFFTDAFSGGLAKDLSTSAPGEPPYKSVIYKNNYSGTQPLGRYAQIDSKTGIITGIAPPLPGNYVVSVLIYEYRNNDVISFHRKDITLVVSDCSIIEASLQKTYINCKDSTFYFSNLVFPQGILTYDWDFGDGNHSTEATPVYTYGSGGIYPLKLVINKGLACEDSAKAEVRVFPGFSPDFETLGTCKDFPVKFNDKTTANYGTVNKWSWDFGDGFSSTAQNPTHTYAVAKNYVVMLAVTSSVGCWATSTKILKIDTKPAFIMSPKDTLICSVDTLQIAAIGTGTAVWSPNYNISDVNVKNPLVSPDVTTTYSVLLTDAFGCMGTEFVKIRVVDRVTQSGNYDTTICQTDTIKLRLVSDAIYFTWTPNDGSLNNTAIKNPMAYPMLNTSYKVLGKISNKCFAENAITVKPVPYPKAIATDIDICLGQSAQLHASGGSIYNWSPDIYLSAVNIPDPLVIKPLLGVQYKLTVRDVLGCPKPVQKFVKLKVTKIIADAGPRDTAVVLGQPLQIVATGGTTYQWLNNNSWLSNININNPVALPKNDIEYMVKVTNATGCFAYDSIMVKVYKLIPGIYLPNAFTPNGDSRNDYFKPIILGVKSLDMFSIYNRVGQIIYSSTDNKRGWDGTFAGNKLETGTFVWVAEATDYNNKKIYSKGTFILMR